MDIASIDELAVEIARPEIKELLEAWETGTKTPTPLHGRRLWCALETPKAAQAIPCDARDRPGSVRHRGG